MRLAVTLSVVIIERIIYISCPECSAYSVRAFFFSSSEAPSMLSHIVMFPTVHNSSNANAERVSMLMWLAGHMKTSTGFATDNTQ